MGTRNAHVRKKNENFVTKLQVCKDARHARALANTPARPDHAF